jgi:dihydroneopterin aldolase
MLLSGMSFYGYHGDLPAERELGARYSVDLELGVDLEAAAGSDDISTTVDYVHVYSLVREVMEEQQHRLLESMAAAICERLLALPRVSRVTVRVGKTPPVRGTFGQFAVELTRPVGA